MARTITEELMNTVTEKENTMENMTVKEFAQAVAERIEGAIVNEVIKNNGVAKQGITLRTDGSNVAPTLYADDWFEQNVSVDDTAREMIEVFARNTRENMDFDWFADFEMVAPKLRMKLVNKASVVDDSVYISAEDYGFEDLVLIPYVIVQVDDMVGSITLHIQHIKQWKKSAEDICTVAMNNTLADKDSAEVLPIAEMLKRMGAPIFFDELPIDVVSSKSQTHGAVMAIVMQDELKKKYPNGYIIIPSSVHEVLVVPKNIPGEMMSLVDMIKEVNTTCVKPEEILSDRPYEFAA